MNALVQRRNHRNNVLVVDEHRGDGFDDRVRPLNVRLVGVPLGGRDAMARVVEAANRNKSDEIKKIKVIDALSTHPF